MGQGGENLQRLYGSTSLTPLLRCFEANNLQYQVPLLKERVAASLNPRRENVRHISYLLRTEIA